VTEKKHISGKIFSRRQRVSSISFVSRKYPYDFI